MVTVKKKLVWETLKVGTHLCCNDKKVTESKFCPIVGIVIVNTHEHPDMAMFEQIRESVHALTEGKR